MSTSWPRLAGLDLMQQLFPRVAICSSGLAYLCARLITLLLMLFFRPNTIAAIAGGRTRRLTELPDRRFSCPIVYLRGHVGQYGLRHERCKQVQVHV